MGVPCSQCNDRREETRNRIERWIMEIELGYFEGDICNRFGCDGIIAHREVEGCSCHINPPCSACAEERAFCTSCDWDARDDDQNDGVATVEIHPYVRLLPQKERALDPTKIDWRTESHTSSSMRRIGVYPPEATMADVEAMVQGSFGGRFKHFSDGTFDYIAYTD